MRPNLLNDLIDELIKYRDKGGYIEEYQVKTTLVKSKFELSAICRSMKGKI